MMNRKKSKRKVYFGKQLQQIVKQYIEQDDQEQKQYLFKTHINFAFTKIASSLVHKYKIQQRIQNAQVMVLQCVANMVEKAPQLDTKRGKAFTYFTVVARNYILSQLDKGIKYNERFKSLNEINDQGKEINLLEDCSVDVWRAYAEKRRINIIMDATIERLVKEVKQDMIPTLKKQSEIQITYAILQIINDIDLLSNFNKKAIMVYITEMTNRDAETINKVLKRVGKYYFRIKQQVIEQSLDLLQYQ